MLTGAASAPFRHVCRNNVGSSELILSCIRRTESDRKVLQRADKQTIFLEQNERGVSGLTEETIRTREKRREDTLTVLTQSRSRFRYVLLRFQTYAPLVLLLVGPAATTTADGRE